MDTAQWPQPTNEMERRRKRSEEPLNKYCPRCNSKHTKFCYYNSYSLTQPRYLCKTCRRYWTHGGSLRTIPVGGGGTGTSRKHKTTRSSSKNKPPLFLPPPLPTTLEAKADQDNTSSMAAFPDDAASSSGFGDFIRPALGFFSLDGGDPLNQEEGTTSEMPLLPFETLKPPPSSSPSSNGGIEYNYHSKRYSDDLLAHDKEEAAEDRSAGFWSDMFSDESWQLYTK